MEKIEWALRPCGKPCADLILTGKDVGNESLTSAAFTESFIKGERAVFLRRFHFVEGIRCEEEITMERHSSTAPVPRSSSSSSSSSTEAPRGHDFTHVPVVHSQLLRTRLPVLPSYLLPMRHSRSRHSRSRHSRSRSRHSRSRSRRSRSRRSRSRSRTHVPRSRLS